MPPWNLKARVVVPWLILMRHDGSDMSSVWSWRNAVGCTLAERGSGRASGQSALERLVYRWEGGTHVYGSGHVELRDGALFDPPAEEGESVAVLLDVGFLEGITARGRS